MLFVVSVKDGTVTRKELFELSQELDRWKPLGRKLGIEDAKLTNFKKIDEELDEQAYEMLRHWKQSNASDATYRVLYKALCIVDRKDLANKFCLADTSTS